MPLDISHIDMSGKELVDENHPDVAALIRAGYTVDESIRAVEKCGTRKAALHYLEMLESGVDEESYLDHTKNQQQLVDHNTSNQDNFQDWLSYTYQLLFNHFILFQ